MRGFQRKIKNKEPRNNFSSPKELPARELLLLCFDFLFKKTQKCPPKTLIGTITNIKMVMNMEITDKEVFEIALNAEIKAKEAYEKMASLVKSDIIRDELLFLAKEEDKHRQIIEKMAEKFKESEGEPKKIEIEVMGEFKVIAEKMAEAIKKPDFNLDEVYEIAMEAELVSEKLYKELASYGANEKTKFVLKMLADMERQHFNILKKQYEYIMQYPDVYKEELYDQLIKDINFNF
ncbi:hypothetical protein TSIB_1871 [Thermococcus sibiricus MM 739]|uniref:Rubrerythrin diiron-binding domain-containing protein n=3 Tax=Thermococcaceae TaxID=2259 RepID=C5ZZT9_THESM|nr:hypothetical protein TSIB_1871 [Thermococcus sibiricus MM 739]